MSWHTLSLEGTKTPRCSDDLECRLRKLAEAGPSAIDERLAHLERTWTAGRASKASVGIMIVLGLFLGLTVNPYWLLLPLACGVILAEYLVRRQSVLGGLFRGLGLPSGADVEQEKLALKALRGDFKHLPTVHQIVDDDDISRLEGEGGIVYESDEPRADPADVVKEVGEVARKA